jgi:Ca2+-binding RTX toxin-like protein
MRLVRPVFVCTLAAFAALTACSAAEADVVPSLNAAGRLEIRMTASGDRAVIARSGSALVLTGNGSSASVGTMTTIEEIAFVDVSGGGTEAAIDLGGGRLTGIAIAVDLGADPGNDTMRILGETDGDRIYLGLSGVNLTADEDQELDVHAPVGVDRWVLEGRGGHDLLSASGGSQQPVGGDMTAPVEIIAGPGGGLYSGGSGDDIIRGGSGNDQLYAGGGNDLVTSGGGSDKFSGGVGDDVLDNGPGPDAILGGAGRDQLVHLGIGVPVDIDLGRSGSEGIGGAGADRIDGIEAVTGTPFADRLAGNEGTNRIDGSAGGDVLSGGGGDDMLVGGEGDDLVSGDAGQDIVDGGPGQDAAGYASSPGGVSVHLTAGGGGVSSAASGADKLTGIEDVVGSPHNDSLTGNAGPNRLSGEGGRDRLIGGPGSDALIGGADDDAIKSADRIRDVVECGAGNDTFDADRIDRLDGCEERGGGARRMEVLAVSYLRRSGRAAVRLRCPYTASFACRGGLRLAVRVRSRGRVRRLRAAPPRQFSAILAGRTRTITRSLRPAARRALRRGGRRAKLVVVVAARDGGRRNVGVRVARRPLSSRRR